MDDLSGLDWSSKPNGSQSKPPPMNPSFPSLQPVSSSPFASGRNTPTTVQQPAKSGSQAAPTAVKVGQDSFSNLARFGPAKSTQNLSLAERQKQLEAERRQKEEEKRKQQEAQFGDGSFWDTLGSRGTAASPALKQPAQTSAAQNDEDDLFAAFNKDTKVDNASHYPPPEPKRSTPALDLSDPSAWGGSSSKPQQKTLAPEDDDPFGLSEVKQSSQLAQQQAPADDDFLGDLGRPVEELRARQQASQPAAGRPIEGDDSSSDDEPPPPPRRQQERRREEPRQQTGGDEFDRAVAQLVDYGFAPDDARRGLTESGAGLNVQAAANWLLDDAHRKAKAKASGRSPSESSNRPERRDNRSPAGGENDLAAQAAAMGTSFFKTANSLWKTGQKKMQQAVAEFQHEGGDPNQPRWMREAQLREELEARGGSSNATDEAMMLEGGGRPRPRRTHSRQQEESMQPPRPSRATPSPQPPSSRSSPVPRWQQQSAPPTMFDSKAKLNRLAADDDISGYSSPNRRRRQQPQATDKKQPEPAAEPEVDLLFGTNAPPKPAQSLPQRPATQPPKRQTPKPASPAPPRPSRQVPPINAEALATSTKHRLAGTGHFKRGDYASAHSSYSSALAAVPSTHPLAILLLANRALTALKTGEPKQAVTDADQALELIGPGNGQGETVAVRNENGQDENRDLKDIHGKALTRKAEALEQMERWAEAGSVWQQCVEAGAGGASAIKGRQRCQNALAPKPKPAPKPAAKPRPRPTATASMAPQKSSEAVTRLREANEAAAKEDDEKFALSESVDARIAAWRDGKRENLRALLGSLDTVLWPESGWKKVGMHELVMANKVKISYMKAIAKTHPDKVSCVPSLYFFFFLSFAFLD